MRVVEVDTCVGSFMTPNLKSNRTIITIIRRIIKRVRIVVDKLMVKYAI